MLQTLLAERMLLYVARPYLSPLAAVPFVSVVAAGEVVVVLFHLLLVSRAVLFAFLCELLAAWVPAWTFRFPWHACRLLPCITKAPEEFILQGLSNYLVRFSLSIYYHES